MKSLLLKVTALVLIASIPALGQSTQRDIPRLEGYRFDFTGGGARAEGMGKAFIGLSDDNTAGSWNPAGLYELEKPIISLSYGALLPRGFSIGDSVIAGYNDRIDHSGSISGITALNFVAPLRLKGHPFVGSFSYTRNFDDYQAMLASESDSIEYIYNAPLRDTMISTRTLTSELEGGMNTVNFGLGTRIYQNISAGVVLNVYTGKIIRDEMMYDVRLDHKDADGAIYRQDTTSQTLDSNKFAGYNFTVGFKYNGEQLSAGLLIRTPFDLTVNTVRSIFDVNYKNGLTIDAGTDTTYFEDVKLKYQMPIMLGLGVSYKLDELTTLAADIEYRGFDGQKIRVRDSILLDPGGSNTEYYTDVDPGWKNVLVLRGGAEHIFENDFARVPVRIGGGYVPYPAPNITDVGTMSQTSTTASSIQLSAGAGLWWEQIHLDIAYTYTRMDWDYVYMGDHGSHVTKIDDNGDPQESAPYFNGALPFTQNSRDHHVSVTFTGYF